MISSKTIALSVLMHKFINVVPFEENHQNFHT